MNPTSHPLLSTSAVHSAHSPPLLLLLMLLSLFRALKRAHTLAAVSSFCCGAHLVPLGEPTAAASRTQTPPSQQQQLPAAHQQQQDKKQSLVVPRNRANNSSAPSCVPLPASRAFHTATLAATSRDSMATAQIQQRSSLDLALANPVYQGGWVGWVEPSEVACGLK